MLVDSIPLPKREMFEEIECQRRKLTFVWGREWSFDGI